RLAVDWEARPGSPLLKGQDLKQSELALTANQAKDPRPTELQQRYVRASRSAAAKRQRITLAAVAFALAVAICLGVLFLFQRNTASARARIATSRELAA